MATLNQIIRVGRFKIKKNKRVLLEQCPQKKGVCVKLLIRTPRKPNSAKRKLARVRLSNQSYTFAYIPGGAHNLKEHSVVLVRGGRTKDVPGLQYKVIRGKYDLEPLLSRKKRRSKFGVPRT